MKEILRTFLILTTLVGCATHHNTAQADMKFLLFSGAACTTVLGCAGYGVYRLYTDKTKPFLNNAKNKISTALKSLDQKIHKEKIQYLFYGFLMGTGGMMLQSWF